MMKLKRVNPGVRAVNPGVGGGARRIARTPPEDEVFEEEESEEVLGDSARPCHPVCDRGRRIASRIPPGHTRPWSAILGHVRPSWGRLDHCMLIASPSRADLGLSWGHLAAMFSYLGAIFGPSWCQLAAMLSYLGAIFGPSWGQLGPSGEYLGASLSHLANRCVHRVCLEISPVRFLHHSHVLARFLKIFGRRGVFFLGGSAVGWALGGGVRGG